MRCVGSDLGQRCEDKTPLVHGGMRNLQAGLIHDLIAKQHDVDVNLARTLFARAETAHVGFDAQRKLEQLARRLLRLDGQRAVQKPGLVGDIDRLSFIERGDGEHAACCSQLFDGREQVGGAISQIRAQRQVCDFAHEHSFAGDGLRIHRKMNETSHFSLSSLAEGDLRT